MSDTKRQELIAAGRLREDGTRIERCPLCGNDLTDEEHQRIMGAVAQAEAVALDGGTGDTT